MSENPMQCSYCDDPAEYSIITNRGRKRPDQRQACDKHEVEARLDALRGRAPKKDVDR